MERLKGVYRFAICILSLGLLLWLCYQALNVNATTAALSFLLLVLVIASLWGLREAMFTSLLAVLAFNFYFLPPIGTFTISDPQNWIALFAFLITAFIASQLSVRARGRAEEALARRKELEQLYELSRAMLMDERNDSLSVSMARASAIFGIDQITYYDLGTEQCTSSGTTPPLPEEVLAGVARSGEPLIGPGFCVVPVAFGSRAVGSLAIHGRNLSIGVRESIAGLIAINFERAKALDRALVAEAARRNESFKSSMLDGLAHDLKTPLTAIRTCVTRLIEIPPRSEQVRVELLSIIDQESSRLQSTIGEAIELARVESAKLTLEREEVNLKELVLKALADARDEDQTRYRVDIPDALTLAVDAQLLQQALKQILENSWKYTPAGSPVEISARQERGSVYLDVSDFGPGLAADETERIFQKFYRGRRNRGQAEGTGMGLAIAKGIIEAHGGRIRAENKAGGGARFVITIPSSSERPV